VAVEQHRSWSSVRHLIDTQQKALSKPHPEAAKRFKICFKKGEAQ
jgi:hypothetical protein